MKRLAEDESLLDGPDQRLAELFRAARPYRVDPFRKRRVLVRLERTSVRNARRYWVRPIVAVSLLVSGSAAAALGNRYFAQGLKMLGLASAGNSSAASVVSKTPRPTAARHVIPSAVEAPTQRADEPAFTHPDRQPNATHGKRTSVRVRTVSHDDATHVLEAIHVLRTERDPIRAQALLDSYLNAHPRGQLSGDALALSIEAAAARNDPRAADYAQRYLAAYPGGTYRALAKRALEMGR